MYIINVTFWYRNLRLVTFACKLTFLPMLPSKYLLKTISCVLFSPKSLYCLDSVHCVKASHIILVGSEFTEFKQTLQACVCSLKKLNFMLTMSSAQGYAVSSWDHNIWAETCSVCSKLPPLNGLQCPTDPRELFDLPACAFQWVLISVLLRVEQTWGFE